MKLMALYATLTQADISRILLLPIIILALWIILLVVLQLTLKEKPEPKPLMAKAGAESLAEASNVEEPSEQEASLEEPRPEQVFAGQSFTSQEPQAISEEEATEEASAQEMEASQDEEPLFEPNEKAYLDEEPALDNSHESTPESEEELAIEEEPVPLSPEPEPEPEPRVQPEAVPESALKPEASRAWRATEAQEVVEPVEPEPPLEARAARETQKVAPPEEIEEEGEFVTPPPQEAPKSQPPELFPPTIHSHALEQSLAAELSRNQDLALMLILCELSGDSDPSALALGVTIRDYFATDSLVFELGRGCYAALLPGSDAGSSLKLAVDLDDVLTTTASLYKDLAEEPPFYFGISGRYDRAIEPERLYKEAYAALKHAHESGSRILAFKPANPAS